LNISIELLVGAAEYNIVLFNGKYFLNGGAWKLAVGVEAPLWVDVVLAITSQYINAGANEE